MFKKLSLYFSCRVVQAPFLLAQVIGVWTAGRRGLTHKEMAVMETKENQKAMSALEDFTIDVEPQNTAEVCRSNLVQRYATNNSPRSNKFI